MWRTSGLKKFQFHSDASLQAFGLDFPYYRAYGVSCCYVVIGGSLCFFIICYFLIISSFTLTYQFFPSYYYYYWITLFFSFCSTSSSTSILLSLSVFLTQYLSEATYASSVFMEENTHTKDTQTNESVQYPLP